MNMRNDIHGIAEGVHPYSSMPGPPLWPVLGNMPQTLAFMKQEAHPHHVIWTQFADKYGGIYRLKKSPSQILQGCLFPSSLKLSLGIMLHRHCRLEIPGHRFVVVNDPAVLPAIIGRPGLPKWAAYQNVVPVSNAAGISRTNSRLVHRYLLAIVALEYQEQM